MSDHQDSTRGQPQLPSRQGPLAGLKIVDCSGVAAGPFGSMLLADLGADVVKVERPVHGDDTRRMDVNYRGGESGYYLGLNKNKRSIALSLADDEDRRTLLGLIDWCDVFIEGFRPGQREKLGIDYASLSARSPRLVYCSIKGYGSVGESSDLPGYDLLAQATSGLMDITGEPHEGPSRLGSPVVDLATGIYAALGIVCAVRHAEHTGQGQHITVSLVGSAISLLAPYTVSSAFGTDIRRCGSAHSTLAPYQAFQDRDGTYFVVAVANDSLWQRTCAALSLGPLAADPRFITNQARAQRQNEVAAVLGDLFRAGTAEHWVTTLRRAGVPACLVNTLPQMLGSDEWRANGYLVDLPHPTAGQIPVVVAPLQMSQTPVTVRSPPPLLNEHEAELRAIADSTATAPRRSGPS